MTSSDGWDGSPMACTLHRWGSPTARLSSQPVVWSLNVISLQVQCIRSLETHHPLFALPAKQSIPKAR